MFNTLAGLASSYITELLGPYEPCCLKSSGRSLLAVLIYNLKTQDGLVFAINAANPWNDLPGKNMYHEQVLNLFKLKTHLDLHLQC